MNRKNLNVCLVVSALLVALAGGMLARRAHAQVATEYITVGGGGSLKINANQFLAVPACSKAAGCEAKIQICNTNPNGTANSAACITLNGTADTIVWVGTQDTVTTTVPATSSSAATTSETQNSFPWGTLTVQGFPPAETNSTP